MMNRRNKIISIILIIVIIIIVGSVAIGYYLIMNIPMLGIASNSNPLEALRMAGKVLVNDLTQTPVKDFNKEEADLYYNRSVVFAEDKLDLKTAEQIIDWSITHNNQPWVDNISKFLLEAEYSLTDTTAHFFFIECESGNIPVMTITYYSANQMLLVEKGWVKRVTHNSYSLIATESVALEIIKLNSEYQLIVKIIVENLNNEIKFDKETNSITPAI
jgi:hypothetical protein